MFPPVATAALEYANPTSAVSLGQARVNGEFTMMEHNPDVMLLLLASTARTVNCEVPAGAPVPVTAPLELTPKVVHDAGLDGRDQVYGVLPPVAVARPVYEAPDANRWFAGHATVSAAYKFKGQLIV